MIGSRACAVEEIAIVSGNARQLMNLRTHNPAFTITPKPRTPRPLVTKADNTQFTGRVTGSGA